MTPWKDANFIAVELELKMVGRVVDVLVASHVCRPLAFRRGSISRLLQELLLLLAASADSLISRFWSVIPRIAPAVGGIYHGHRWLNFVLALRLRVK